MPTQDVPSAQPKKVMAHEEKAIVRALVRYFEAAPSKATSATGTSETSIINALHRYFVKK